MVREIVFDTETTGFDEKNGDRIVEIGAVELENHIPTGRTYHQYINPQRDMPEEAFKVHGLSTQFLQDFPVFEDIIDDFLDFVGTDSKLVAHNASFDIKFLNQELSNINKEGFAWERVIDTLEIAKKKFPGSKNNLDALCKRFNVDNSSRTSHGALLDSQLLAQVYLELIGGKEPVFALKTDVQQKAQTLVVEVERSFKPSRNFHVTAEEMENHENFLNSKLKNAIWNN